MPSWWGKSWSNEGKTKKSKESFIDTLHKTESKPSGRLGGSRRRASDIVSERVSQSQAVSRSPSPSKHVARCQSFAERPQAQPLTLPGMCLRVANVRRTDSGIRESAKPKRERVSKSLLFPHLPRPTCIWQKPDPTDMDGEVIVQSISSECSIESDDPADSHQRSPRATDYDVGSRTAAGSPYSSFVRDQSSVAPAISRESPITVNLSATKSVSSPPKRRPLSGRVPNLQVPHYGAFFSAPDSSMSSPSRSPMSISGYEQVSGSASPAGKLFPEHLLLGSGQCSSPGSGQTSGHNSMGGDMSGQLFWQPSRGSPEYSSNPSPRMASPGPSSRIQSGAVTPVHPRAGGGHSESLNNRPDDSRQQSHRLPLPPITISNSSPFSQPNSAVASPSVPRSPGRAENLASPGSRWKRGKLLGRGTFGHVYVGFNSETGEMCAMKEVTLFADDAKSKESAKQLGQEIALLSRLKHPNIVQYYASETVSDRLYIYLEYVSGGSIHKILQEYGILGESAIRSYTQQILSGLAYLHAKNTVHRDIKGANILVDPNGRVKLADFGMAKHVTGQTCLPFSFKGSPYWTAPEVIRNSNGCNLAVDIWSLGCTVLEMATSKPPWSQYEGVAAIFKIGNSKELPPIPDHLSDDGKDFVRKCLQRNPQHRLTAAQLLEHPFVKSSVHLEKQILGSASSDHSPMSKAAKSMGISNTRSLQSDPERLAIHSSRVSKSNFNPSDVYVPRNISCPVSPTGSPLLHPRSPLHPSRRMSPSPISSPLTISGSSTPLTGGIGAIPYNQSVLMPDGFSIVPKRPSSPGANTLSYWDPDILKGVHSGSHTFRELKSCHNNALGRKFGRVAHAELYDRQSILVDCVAQQLLRDPAQLNPSVDLNPSSPFPSHRMTGL